MINYVRGARCWSLSVIRVEIRYVGVDGNPSFTCGSSFAEAEEVHKNNKSLRCSQPMFEIPWRKLHTADIAATDDKSNVPVFWTRDPAGPRCAANRILRAPA